MKKEQSKSKLELKEAHRAEMNVLNDKRKRALAEMEHAHKKALSVLRDRFSEEQAEMKKNQLSAVNMQAEQFCKNVMNVKNARANNAAVLSEQKVAEMCAKHQSKLEQARKRKSPDASTSAEQSRADEKSNAKKHKVFEHSTDELCCQQQLPPTPEAYLDDNFSVSMAMPSPPASLVSAITVTSDHQSEESLGHASECCEEISKFVVVFELIYLNNLFNNWFVSLEGTGESVVIEEEGGIAPALAKEELARDLEQLLEDLVATIEEGSTSAVAST